jgi:uncharacterized protein YjiS (DUF1127 family)
MRARHTQPLTYDDIKVGEQFESLAGRSNAGRLRAFGSVVRAWFDCSRQRRALSELDDRLLRDIGLTRAQAQREAAKPFCPSSTIETARSRKSFE